MRTSDAGLGRWREKLQRYPVWIAEGDSRAVAGVLDSAVRDAQLIQARGPGLQLIAVTAGEGNMIQAGTMLVEPVTCSPGVRMQAEQLPAEREYGVVKSSGLLVLVENGPVASSPLYQRALRSRSVTVTATWTIGGNSATATSD